LLHLTDFERFYPHEQGISDAMRPAERLQWIKENRDPLKIFGARVTASGQLKQGELSAIDEDVTALVEGVLAAAKAAPDISAKNLLTDVYVSY
jgi:TPP-dependent pyruvate/acetoin dehydrogenase alpha subunit